MTTRTSWADLVGNSAAENVGVGSSSVTTELLVPPQLLADLFMFLHIFVIAHLLQTHMLVLRLSLLRVMTDLEMSDLVGLLLGTIITTDQGMVVVVVDLVEEVAEVVVGIVAETEANPFGNDDDEEQVFSEQESTGINFDAYEDIPVETSGDNVPSPVNTFVEIDLGEALNLNIRRCKYVKPTPVQRHAIPISLAGRDLMACAQTGSGKTAAFCFPIISGIMRGQVPQRPLRGARTIYPLATSSYSLSYQGALNANTRGSQEVLLSNRC